jgi:hypothetical protein
MLTYEWEKALINDYRHYRCHRLLEHVCDKLRLWKAGQVTRDEMDRFMGEIHQQSCEVRDISRQRSDRVVNLIQWWDREWSLEWVKSHSPPAEAVLPEPPELPTESWE